MPEAVSKHDVVRGLSELSNVALGRAQETGGVKKLAAAFPGLFLSPFPRLGGDVDAFVSGWLAGKDSNLQLPDPESGALSQSAFANSEANLTLLFPTSSLESGQVWKGPRPLSQTPYRPTPWPRIVKAYLSAGVDSPNTRRAYARHLSDAFGALGVTYVDELTGPLLAEYRAAVLATDLAPGSQGLALAALRSFLSWSRAMGAHSLSGEVVRTALRTPRHEVRRPYQVLSDSEVRRIIAAASTARDRALLGLMLGAGLRVSEVVGLDVRDIVLDSEGEAIAWVRQGKGRKDRLVPLRAEVTDLLRAYLAATGRALGQFGPLFRAHDRGASLRARRRLTARAVGYVVHEAAARAGIAAKAISPHSLRHTMAIRSLRGGASVVAVSKVLGHASIATTQRYLDHLELGELRASMPALPPTEATP